MTWTRRSFLKTMLAGAVAVVAAPVAVPELEAFFQPTFPPFDPEKAFSIYDILAWAKTPGEDRSLMFQVERENGSVLLRAGMHSRGTFRWVAMPEHELVDPAKDGYRIVNGSDADLDVIMHVEQGGEHYQFRGNEYTHIGHLPVEHDDEEEEVFGESFEV